MLISIQEHVLPWETESALRSSALLLWDKLCSQHQPWANSFLRPCTAVAPGAQHYARSLSWMTTLLGKPKKGASKWWWWLWVAQIHRAAVLATGSDKHAAEYSGNWKNLNSQTSWKEKLLRKVSSIKVKSGNNCNFPEDPAPVFAQGHSLQTVWK